MGRCVIKESPEVDFYVEYSSIIEAPICCGTRAEVEAYMREDTAYASNPEAIERMLAKADEKGGSAPFWEGAWDDCGTIMQQRGICPRESIGEFARRYLAGDFERAFDLLEPFEDLGEVRRGNHPW